jgi:WD40 repeat protein
MAPIESEFLLKPDPIMALDKIIGVYANSCRDVKFSCTPKYSESVAFSSSTVLISEDTSSLKQKFFISHSTPVTSIYAFEKYLLTVSSYSENEIIIWEYDCKDKVCMFKPPLSKVIQLAVSYKGTYLLIAGKDMYNREIMVIYNFQELLNQQYEVKMKQISDFNITHISPSPFDETDFVAVGFENIRVWKMKKTILSNSQVPIYENSKKKEFITINYILANELSKTAKCIYVFSKCGIGIQFNLNRNV